MSASYAADPFHTSIGAAVATSSGFTAADFALLGRVRATPLARQRWGREQFVSNEFAHYLAVWGPAADAADPPAFALARFKKTGTYALTMGTTVIASGPSLGEVLCALAPGFD